MNKSFYDELAPYYHLIFNDWESSMNRQAGVLDGIIRSEWGDDVNSILDVACGIGTQAMGLAKLGYRVEASDLSSKAVERAKQETLKRGLKISYSVSDMREVSANHKSLFDVLICCDNSIAHLLSDREIKDAFSEFFCCLKPEGGCIITLRDYENEARDKQIIPYKVHLKDGIRYILFQIWDFSGDIYDQSLYLITDDGEDKAEARVFNTKSYAITIPKVISLMKEAGFAEVKQSESGFYQPVVIGTKMV